METIDYVSDVIKVIAFIAAVIVLIRNRKGIPVNTFYLSLLATLLSIYAGVEDLITGASKSMVWFPANIAMAAVIIIGACRYHSRKSRKDYIADAVKEAIDRQG